MNPHYCEMAHDGHNTLMEQLNGSIARGVRMLLVDDHDDYRALMRHFLSSEESIHLDLAPNAEAALALVEINAYDLILLDIQMPGIDGYQLTRTLRTKGFQRPIIAVTAHAMPIHKQRALEAGCDALYTKPVPLPVIREAIFGYL